MEGQLKKSEAKVKAIDDITIIEITQKLERLRRRADKVAEGAEVVADYVACRSARPAKSDEKEESPENYIEAFTLNLEWLSYDLSHIETQLSIIGRKFELDPFVSEVSDSNMPGSKD